MNNQAAISTLPFVRSTTDLIESLMPGDTVAVISKRLSLPDCEVRPVIGIVTEHNAHLVAIHWDGYKTAWDYSERELQGKLQVISRAVQTKLRKRYGGRPLNITGRTDDNFLLTDDGEFISADYF